MIRQGLTRLNQEQFRDAGASERGVRARDSVGPTPDAGGKRFPTTMPKRLQTDHQPSKWELTKNASSANSINSAIYREIAPSQVRSVWLSTCLP